MKFISRIRARLNKASILLVLVALLVGVSASSITFYILKPDTWAPLGEYPIQRVDSRIPGINVPAVYSDDFVMITGTKCNDTDKVVNVRGTLSWSLKEPGKTNLVGPDDSVAPQDGVAPRDPGCTTTEFPNPIPQAVVAITKQLGGKATWALVGIETPIRPGKPDGVPVTWVSQNFLVVVR